MSSRAKTRKASDYVIAIPSYKRVETLKEKTLATLAKYKISASKIYIFVANKEEEAAYKAGLEPDTYAKIVVGVPKI
jgi:cellulose synthase/poly-beta-1,6-N-acetylglucosamine synthase-like glycosyltransferase